MGLTVAVDLGDVVPAVAVDVAEIHAPPRQRRHVGNGHPLLGKGELQKQKRIEGPADAVSIGVENDGIFIRHIAAAGSGRNQDGGLFIGAARNLCGGVGRRGVVDKIENAIIWQGFVEGPFEADHFRRVDGQFCMMGDGDVVIGLDEAKTGMDARADALGRRGSARCEIREDGEFETKARGFVEPVEIAVGAIDGFDEPRHDAAIFRKRV